MSPLYDYRCPNCGRELSKVHGMNDPAPDCCDLPMHKLPTYPVMVKVMGMGGYPSRRKFVKGSAPYTTRATKAWLDEDPYESTAKAQHNWE